VNRTGGSQGHHDPGFGRTEPLLWDVIRKNVVERKVTLGLYNGSIRLMWDADVWQSGLHGDNRPYQRRPPFTERPFSGVPRRPRADAQGASARIATAYRRLGALRNCAMMFRCGSGAVCVRPMA